MNATSTKRPFQPHVPYLESPDPEIKECDFEYYILSDM